MINNRLPHAKGIPLLRLAGTLLALGLLVFLLSKQGWNEIGAAISSIAVWRFVIATLLTVISRLAIGVRWHLLIHAVEPRISLKQALSLTFAGLFASNFLPTTIGGDVVRLGGTIRLKFDGVLSAASLIMDRLVGIAGMTMVLPFGLPKFFAGQIFARSNPLSALENVGMGGIMSSPSGVLLRKILDAARRVTRKLFDALSHWVSHPRALLQALVFTWIHMLSLFGSIHILFKGMDEEISFWLIAGLWSLVYFITLVPISINGYGVQELSTSFLFTEVGGISPQNSLTIALIIRTLQMVVSLPGALFLSGTILGENNSSSAENQA